MVAVAQLMERRNRGANALDFQQFFPQSFLTCDQRKRVQES
jgi:hypothetical protein